MRRKWWAEAVRTASRSAAYALTVSGAIALAPSIAMGGQTGAGTLTDVANAYKAASAGWISTALGYAQHLFFALVAIELAWTAITYALQRDSVSEFVAQVVLKFMGVFFFLALLQNAPTWMPYIINSFSQAGSTIGGQAVVLDPSSMFGQGLQLAKNMLGTISNPSFFTAMMAVLIATLCAIGVVVAFAVVAGQLMVTLIESYIVVSAGIFFLGFGGSRWTLPFSEKYIAYAVSVGIKLFMLYLIVGLGETLATQWAALFTPGVIAPPDVYVGVAGSALVFMLLGWHIPGLAAALMNGSPMMTLGTAASTVSTTAAGGVAMAAGVAGAAVGSAASVGQLQRAGEAASSPVIGSITGAHQQLSASGVVSASGSSGRPPAAAGGAADPPSRPFAANSRSVSPGIGAAAQTSGSSSPGTSANKRDSTGASDADPSGSPDGDAPGSESKQAAPPTATMPDSSSGKDRRQPSAPASTAMGRPRSIIDLLRNVRPPTFPNDAAGGTIHIRFRHHESE
ncbi:MAG: P-type conjugative transfer protein TrbL [Candidatus Eremiobacteraeota bacterium]|nr:P-type conjugative transfer protein TrbL [Candidatus Eremiobacteraeota bacterium]MBC5826828.1 P-type conjugative transfer protein TrbL [Candidatus Eremiobacteraeota bacterium]